jgi:hypothetical protein
MPNWITQTINGNIQYPQIWESSRILIRIVSSIPPVWRKAGYLKIYDIPGGYTGIINGIWEAGATGSCVVHEFSYL